RRPEVCMVQEMFGPRMISRSYDDWPRCVNGPALADYAADWIILSDRRVHCRTGEIRHDDGARGRLSTKELAVLCALDEREGEVCSRDELHQELWGYTTHTLSRACDVAVVRLRKKLERDPADPR